MMSDLLVVYVFTISIELMLGLVLAVTLLMIVAPLKSRDATEEQSTDDAPPAAPIRRDLPSTPAGALQVSFRSLARGEDDLPMLLHTRQLLLEYLDSRERSSDTGSRS